MKKFDIDSLHRPSLKYRLYQFLTKIGVPLCHGHCGYCFKIGKRRRQNTKYAEDEMNYVFCCKNCFEQIEACWAEQWDDYYSSQGVGYVRR